MNNHHEFITAIEAAYKIQYEEGLLFNMIQEYLSKKSLDELQHLFQQIIKIHPVNWGLPDLSVFHKIEREENNLQLQIKAEQAWQQLLSIGSLHDVLIVDPVTHFVVSGWGSWQRFCLDRDGEYRELVHKAFIERWISTAQINFRETPMRLSGHLREEYGLECIGIQCQIIGDQAAGQRILAGKKVNSQIEQAVNSVFKKVEA